MVPALWVSQHPLYDCWEKCLWLQYHKWLCSWTALAFCFMDIVSHVTDPVFFLFMAPDIFALTRTLENKQRKRPKRKVTCWHGNEISHRCVWMISIYSSTRSGHVEFILRGGCGIQWRSSALHIEKTIFSCFSQLHLPHARRCWSHKSSGLGSHLGLTSRSM